MIRKKILLLGDFSVGKTSLIRRYVDGTFDDKYLTTIGVKISKKLCTINDVDCEILIWDVEGATPTKKIPQSYYRGASGAIFVTDVNRSETLESLQSHIDVFLEENNDAKYVIAYNKADLLTEKQMNKFELNAHTFLTSAKSDNKVEEIFVSLMKEMLI